MIRPTKFGQQALEVRQGDRRGLLLPSVAVTANLTPRGYVDEVIDKAGITRPPYHWTRYDTEAWLADASGPRRLRHGLPVGEPAPTGPEEAERLHGLLLDYSRRHHVQPDEGPPTGRYEVFADRLRSGLAPARLAYGAWVRATAGLRAEAEDDVRRLDAARGDDGWAGSGRRAVGVRAGLPPPREGRAGSPGSRAGPPPVGHRRRPRPVRHPRRSRRRHRCMAGLRPRPGPPRPRRAARRGRRHDPARALRRYRMRFRQNHHWGSVAWLTQAFVAWGDTGFAYEIVDWALQPSRPRRARSSTTTSPTRPARRRRCTWRRWRRRGGPRPPTVTRKSRAVPAGVRQRPPLPRPARLPGA